MDAFETSIRRPYFSASNGVGHRDQVWRTDVRAECAAPEDLRYGSFQWDIDMFYEHLQPPKILGHAARIGLHAALARATVRAYRMPRCLSLSGAVSGCKRPFAGVIAGCSAATTWASIGALHAVDHVINTIPRNVDCQVRVYIDDFDVTARAPTNRQTVRALASTARHFIRALEVGEGVPFSPLKAPSSPTAPRSLATYAPPSAPDAARHATAPPSLASTQWAVAADALRAVAHAPRALPVFSPDAPASAESPSHPLRSRSQFLRIRAPSRRHVWRRSHRHR